MAILIVQRIYYNFLYLKRINANKDRPFHILSKEYRKIKNRALEGKV